jgi:hypothetical protein
MTHMRLHVARGISALFASLMALAPLEAAVKPVLSTDAQVALARVVSLRDNAGAPFVVIDKRRARLWVFDRDGVALGSTAVLLGLARGDDTVPGIGDKPLAQIKARERTTPAGRFVAEHGRNAHGEDVVWVDYDAAVSMHRVHNVHAWERRQQRLRTASVADNRISYGCINVPASFFDRVLLPAIRRTRPVVYLLPETRPVASIFHPGVASRQVSLSRFD